MRRSSTAVRVAAGIGAGALLSLAIALAAAAFASSTPRPRLVPEDASGHLRRVAIHYVPQMDARALPVWRQLFAVLPADVEVVVAVSRAPDFDRLLDKLRAAGTPHLARFRRVVVDRPLTTWSRDRMAALDGARGGAVLAPPRVGTPSGGRAGDWHAPFAISRALFGAEPQISEFVFEGGDLAASAGFVFADANLIGRNLGRRDATRATLELQLRQTFAQEVVWLGDATGDVPVHHIMMYMVPLDDRTVLVGDPRLGRAVAGATYGTLGADPDLDGHIARFDRVASILAARGFEVVRAPVVVLEGAGSYITYTNALFDRDADGTRVVYLPTYGQPALDRAAAALYEARGLRVVPIDVSTIYTMNGSLGCLVNVMAR